MKERQLLTGLCMAKPAADWRWLLVAAAYFLGIPVVVLVALTDFQTVWSARPGLMAGAFAGLVLLLAAYAVLRFALRFRRPQVIFLVDCVALATFATALFAVHAPRFTQMPVYLGFYIFFLVLIAYAFVAPRLTLAWKLTRMPAEQRAALFAPFHE